MATNGQNLGLVSALLLSIPQSQIGQAMRSRLVPAWLLADEKGDLKVKNEARRVLAHLLGSGSTDVCRT